MLNCESCLKVSRKDLAFARHETSFLVAFVNFLQIFGGFCLKSRVNAVKEMCNNSKGFTQSLTWKETSYSGFKENGRKCTLCPPLSAVKTFSPLHFSHRQKNSYSGPERQLTC